MSCGTRAQDSARAILMAPGSSVSSLWIRSLTYCWYSCTAGTALLPYVLLRGLSQRHAPAASWMLLPHYCTAAPDHCGPPGPVVSAVTVQRKPGFDTPPPHRPANDNCGYCCPPVHLCRALRSLWLQEKPYPRSTSMSTLTDIDFRDSYGVIVVLDRCVATRPMTCVRECRAETWPRFAVRARWRPGFWAPESDAQDAVVRWQRHRLLDTSAPHHGRQGGFVWRRSTYVWSIEQSGCGRATGFGSDGPASNEAGPVPGGRSWRRPWSR